MLGGDGTILDLTEFSSRNNVPIIGINAGKLGFLTEFERFETEQAVKMLVNNELKLDERLTLNIEVDDRSYIALNEVTIQRLFSENGGRVIGLNVDIDGNSVDKVIGDGIIVCTPTGSTGYSLSAGGAILAPGINAFSVTPISAHSLSNRPVIFSAESNCKVCHNLGDNAVVLVDGKFICYLQRGKSVCVNKSDKIVKFLRRRDFNFFTLLSKKMVGKKEV